MGKLSKNDMAEVLKEVLDEIQSGGRLRALTRKINVNDLRRNIIKRMIERDTDLKYFGHNGSKFKFEGSDEWIEKYGMKKADAMAKKRVRYYANCAKELTSIWG